MTPEEELHVTRRLLSDAHRKIGEARRIVEEFWKRKDAANPYPRETAWAMHVAIVQITELLSRAGNTLGNRNGRTLPTSDRSTEIPNDPAVREGGLEPPHG